jgi:hypothetical protein
MRFVAPKFSLARVVTLVLPLVSFGVVLATNIFIPPLLQLRMSAGEYAAFVVTSSAAGYVGMADGGMLMPLVRELTNLHGRREFGAYLGELWRSARIYSAAALLGLGLGVAAFVFARRSLADSWAPALELRFLVASLGVLLATALRLWIASQHSAMLFSQGRYVLAQSLGITSNLLPALALGLTLYFSRDLCSSLYIYGAAITAHAIAQGLHGWFIYRRDFAKIEREEPTRAFRTVLSEGLAIKAGDTVSTFGFPHALSVFSVNMVPSAVPARTLINSCRLVCQQFVALLEIRTTRHVSTKRADKFDEFYIAAAAVGSFYLICLAAVDLSASVIFQLWLPNRAATIRPFLPGLMIEQALLSAALPSSSLFMAAGRFRALGIAKLGGSLLGIVTLTAVVRFSPQSALGAACAASAVPFFALGAWVELKRTTDFPAPRRETAIRYARALLVALVYLMAPHGSYLGATIALMTSLPSFVQSLLAIARRLQLTPRVATSRAGRM